MFDNLGLSPQQQAIAEKIAAAGFAAGMTEAGVAAMVTHAIHESALNPTLSHPDAPPGSKQQFNSNGLFQMNRDRWDDLVEYAAANGLSPWSADAQIGYQIHEMTNPPKPGISNYQKIAEPLFTSNDPRVTSQAFSKIEGHAKVINGFDEVAERVADTSKLYAGSYNDLAGFKTQVAGPPVSAQAVDAPMPGLTSASMGGLLGPIVAETPAAPPLSSFFQGGPAAGVVAQNGWSGIFDPINFGSAASFNRGPVTNYGSLGAPVAPTLFDGAPDALAYGLPDIPQETPAPAPAPAPASAQLPGLGGMPPAGSFGAMPLGNYQMASIAQPSLPSPQPSANLSAFGQLAPSGTLSLSGRAAPATTPAPTDAIAPRDDQTLTPAGYSPASAPAPSLPVSGDPMGVLSQIKSAEELAKDLPAPPSSGTTTTAITPSGAPTATPTPGVGGFANLDAPTSAPTISMATPNITTAPPSTPGASFGSIPAAGGIPGASLGVDMSSVATPPSTPAAPPSASWQASPLPDFGLGGAAAPPVQTPAAPPSSPAIAPPDDYALPSPQGAPSAPALGIPGASTAVDIQQGLASLPAPTALPETPPPAPAAPHPGTAWGGLANMNTPPGGITAPPTVSPDLLSPSLTPQEAIPTVKAPDTPPTQVAGPGVPLGGLGGLPAGAPSIGAAAPAAAAVRSLTTPAAPPSAPVTGPVVGGSQPAPPSFGGLDLSGLAGTTSTGASPQAINGVLPPNVVGYALGGFGALGPMTPYGYEYAPDIAAIAATGLGPFGALFGGFGGGGFGGDFGSLGSTISGGYDAGPGGPNPGNYAY